MKLLVVSATEGEIRTLLNYLNNNWTISPDSRFVKNGKTIDICITGVGLVAATYSLTKALSKQNYDMALQAGVCGSYDRQLNLGKLVCINSEQFGDLGAEDHDKYLDIFEMGLIKESEFPFMNTKLEAPQLSIPFLNELRPVSGLTVNTVSGKESTINNRMEKFNCQVESMEGVAFHYVCLKEKIAFAQVRSISNYVEPRDKSKWKMKEAIAALNKWLIEFAEQIND